MKPAGGIIITGSALWETKRAASIYPTVDEINALPEKFRLYIHDLETRCDKSGDVQTIAILREDRDALQVAGGGVGGPYFSAGKRISRSTDRNGLNKVSSLSPLSAGLCRREIRPLIRLPAIAKEAEKCDWTMSGDSVERY